MVPLSTSGRAIASSTNPRTGFGAATTSAWSPTFRHRPRADYRCTDRLLGPTYQGELAERHTYGLAKPHLRPPPPHRAAQDALHVRYSVALQDCEGRGSSLRSVHGVEAPHRPRPRPRRLSHLPELFPFYLASHGSVWPGVQA